MHGTRTAWNAQRQPTPTEIGNRPKKDAVSFDKVMQVGIAPPKEKTLRCDLPLRSMVHTIDRHSK